MSVINRKTSEPSNPDRTGETPRVEDPRVARSRAAVVDAAKTLFLKHGYAGTTMEDIARLAGLTKRTVYNNFGDKAALFTQIVADVIDYAEDFARRISIDFDGISATNLSGAFHELGRRLALAILQPHVIALRRLLIGEAREFPELARAYFDRAPGRVIATLATGFQKLDRAGLLQVGDVRIAAEQFAYLVAGAPLDRAVLSGSIPAERDLKNRAEMGVETFLARYAPPTAP